MRMMLREYIDNHHRSMAYLNWGNELRRIQEIQGLDTEYRFFRVRLHDPYWGYRWLIVTHKSPVEVIA